jgi:hypothetical protein
MMTFARAVGDADAIASELFVAIAGVVTDVVTSVLADANAGGLADAAAAILASILSRFMYL